MNTWLKRTLISAATSAALIGSIAAYSHGGPMSAEDMASREARMLEHISKSLDLDAGQQAKLQTLTTQLHTQRDRMTAGGSLHDRFKSLVAGNTFDRAGAQALLDEKVAQLRTSGPAMIGVAGDFYDSLRPDQQQKVRDFMARHHGDMHGTPPDGSRD